MSHKPTIIAVATPSGSGAIAVIRLSGPQAILWVNDCFQSIKPKKLIDQKSHTVHLGYLHEGEAVIDQVLVTLFRGPHSYTGEDVVEISCHGSTYIQQRIMQLFLGLGAQVAQGGEFTLRAFLNGKMDLSQAEAVADLIQSESEAAHQIALQQMRGGFGSQLKDLRAQLMHFASLIELELDFAEEDVAFADRTALQQLLQNISEVLKSLIDSFALGNVLKNGVPVAIIGPPNAGKSTLLNTLLNEDKALISDIPGTTRDAIEDEINLRGVRFRLIDTAGIRQTQDVVEQMGIKKSFEKTAQASLVLYLFDSVEAAQNKEYLAELLTGFNALKTEFPDKHLLLLANKADGLTTGEQSTLETALPPFTYIAAKNKTGIESLIDQLLAHVLQGRHHQGNTIVTNSRHYALLLLSQEAIDQVKQGIAQNRSSDLLAVDIRQALQHFGAITGEISSDELLGNIFSNFCIGK